jgi:hypothetical protein
MTRCAHGEFAATCSQCRLEADLQKVYRANGNTKCLECQKEYWRHPLVDPKAFNGLRKLCNGDHVKL